MKRLLISQNENNDGTDYIVVDGELLDENADLLKYNKKIIEANNWKEIYKDDYLEVKNDFREILLKSFCNEKDVAGRIIYYLYVIDDSIDNIDSVLNYLENDINVIERSFDKARTLKVINKIRKKKEIRRKIVGAISVGIGLLLLLYLIGKIK